MNFLLREMFGHQAWADAEQWRAVQSYAPASADAVIRERLHHIHIVQRAFRWIVGVRDTAFHQTRPDDFDTLAALKTYGRAYHEEIAAFLPTLTPERLDAPIDVPWFNDPPLRITVAQALTQCAMHSQWHRGQNAARLRELGAEPPTLDLIVWYWKGQPPAVWD